MLTTEDEIKEYIRALPEVAEWKKFLELPNGLSNFDFSLWNYPLIACQAVGGTKSEALPVAAAVLCSIISIRLVDDMLDEDCEGLHHKLGAGYAANLALAFQAAGHRLLDQSNISFEKRHAFHSKFAQMSLATAYGQHLDSEQPENEEEYWQMISAKTPPLFGAALYLGALTGGISFQKAERVEQLGFTLGVLVQISDDLSDALHSPAKPDWRRPYGNLAILYALTAEHESKNEFRRLLADIDNQESLSTAQEILIKCGAVSYCIFKVLELSQEIQKGISVLNMPNQKSFDLLISHILEPIYEILQISGIEDGSVESEI